jgi:hypothetical protein
MLSEEKRKELKAAHGRIAEWDVPNDEGQPFAGETVVVKKPKSADYRAFVAAVAKDAANKEAAIRDLVRLCVVHPDGQVADQIFDEYPAAPLEISAAITQLAGGGGEGARIRKN